MDRRTLLIALAALILIVSALFGYSLTSGNQSEEAPAPVQVAKAPDQSFEAACSSIAAYDRLKQLLFRKAAEAGNSDPANFQTLATNSVVRMENPVVRGHDEALGVTQCSGRFVLELPPGAEQGLSGQRRLSADVDYSAQPAVDGSGLVYRLSGADSIVERLASFNLQRQNQQAVAEPVATPDYAEAEADAPSPPSRPARPAPRPQPAAEPVRTASRPSFNCAAARTRSERMVCNSAPLASSDRAMSALYYESIANADSRQRRALTRTRDRFLAYRERCASEACIAEAYQGRMMEIRDIMAGRF